MKKILLILSLILIGSIYSVPYIRSEPASTGTIKGHVLLPKAIDLATVAREAKVYIYLSDYTPVQGKEVFPWNAPVKKVIEHDVISLKSHKIAFVFKDLPNGLFGISVLVDTGKPHVPIGSMNFTAFPGDYAGGTQENVKIDRHQTVEVLIDGGMYITIPDGYKAPLYSPQ